MTTADQLPTCAPSLGGSRILIVQTRPSAVLGLGAAVVRTGARVNVCRSSHAALDVMNSPGNAFDAAVLDGELSRASLIRLSRALRERPNPCLSVGVGTPGDETAVRRLVEAGVMELVIPPLCADAVLDALARCVDETRRLRDRVGASPGGSREVGSHRQ